MTIQDFGSIGELVAAIATVITLGYLAIQIRQNSETVRISAEIDLSQQIVDFHSRISAQPDLVRIWDAAASDPSSLNPEEKSRFRWSVTELFIMYEAQYQIYKKGYFSDNSWQFKIDTLTEFLKNPVLEEWWDMRFAPIGDEFREYIESQRVSPGSWVHRSGRDWLS